MLSFSYTALHCGETIKEQEGWIYPPNPVPGEPDYYIVSCEWMVVIHPAHTLQFQLIFLRIEASEDCLNYVLEVRTEEKV